MPSASESRLTISVVIGGNESLIGPCLKSICEGTRKSFDLYVVSNLSSESIIARIRTSFPQAKILVNSTRKGFAENHNMVINASKTEYVLILNDDTVIPAGSIDGLVAFMEKPENNRVAAVSPKLLNPDNSLQPSTYRFPNLITIFIGLSGLRPLIPQSRLVWKAVSFIEFLFGLKSKTRLWDHSSTCEVDTFRGACVLVRRKAIEEAGLMDEVTLFYGEEIEWHYRFKKLGWKVVFYPGVNIIHYGSQSLGKERKLSAQFQKLKALLNIYRKHHSALSYLLLRFMILFFYSVKYLSALIINGRKSEESLPVLLEILKVAFNPNPFFIGKKVYYARK
jgi:N-acetylglucosaminyl-diphospho-decaprenol L-rhamnosyltransferase